MSESWKRPPVDEFADDRRWRERHPDEVYDFEAPAYNFSKSPGEKPWLKVWAENQQPKVPAATDPKETA